MSCKAESQPLPPLPFPFGEGLAFPSDLPWPLALAFGCAFSIARFAKTMASDHGTPSDQTLAAAW